MSNMITYNYKSIEDYTKRGINRVKYNKNNQVRRTINYKGTSFYRIKRCRHMLGKIKQRATISSLKEKWSNRYFSIINKLRD